MFKVIAFLTLFLTSFAYAENYVIEQTTFTVDTRLFTEHFTVTILCMDRTTFAVASKADSVSMLKLTNGCKKKEPTHGSDK